MVKLNIKYNCKHDHIQCIRGHGYGSLLESIVQLRKKNYTILGVGVSTNFGLFLYSYVRIGFFFLWFVESNNWGFMKFCSVLR